MYSLLVVMVCASHIVLFWHLLYSTGNSLVLVTVSLDPSQHLIPNHSLILTEALVCLSLGNYIPTSNKGGCHSHHSSISQTSQLLVSLLSTSSLSSDKHWIKLGIVSFLRLPVMTPARMRKLLLAWVVLC